MAVCSSKIPISSSQIWFPATYSINSLQAKSLGFNFQYFPFKIRCKKSIYQDFQEYAKPSTLLSATEVKVCRNENMSASFLSGKSESLYIVKLQTSKMYGSGVSDVNSNVLLCLIDENGSSILQRLPATSVGTDGLSEGKVVHDIVHFQRGSVDEFAFEGPHLGKIVAVWIGLESGEWRIGGIDLTVISPKNKQLTGLKYIFEFDDVLLGEKSDTSMMEFRPRSVTAFSEDETEFLYEKSSLGTNPTSNEESMKDYAYLKFSLLFYDAVLVSTGTVASISAGENAAYAFLTGGLCGFFYLLLLQKSVDELASDELISGEKERGFGRIFGRLKGTISSLVLAFAFAIIAVKYASGDDAVKLTPKDLIFGMMGFLTCKVSVVLSAFKPMSLDNKQGS